MKAVRFCRSVDEPTGTNGDQQHEALLRRSRWVGEHVLGGQPGDLRGEQLAVGPSRLQDRAARRQLPAARVRRDRPRLGLGVEVAASVRWYRPYMVVCTRKMSSG